MTNAYVKIIEILADKDKDFIARLAPKTKGKKRQWLSRNPEDMVNSKWARKISPEWWLDPHSSSEAKIRRLKLACEVAEIPFGKPRGLKIVF